MKSMSASSSLTLRDTLSRMIDVLQQERKALASMNMEEILGCAYEKHELCEQLEQARREDFDEEAKGQLDAARRLNEVNRQLRNLIAANVSARLEAIMGGPALYRAAAGQPLVSPSIKGRGAPAYAYAGARG
ncbi:MAG: flagellar protein FlgN [Sphingomonadales bacterium]|nr:flagellar protein FlgN [Sphingomonadales bacterium]MDE2169721.1 flagellar protein FlgN [Sphingomonadales bacterium]